jgi:hypothetical protein
VFRRPVDRLNRELRFDYSVPVDRWVVRVQLVSSQAEGSRVLRHGEPDPPRGGVSRTGIRN